MTSMREWWSCVKPPPVLTDETCMSRAHGARSVPDPLRQKSGAPSAVSERTTHFSTVARGASGVTGGPYCGFDAGGREEPADAPVSGSSSSSSSSSLSVLRVEPPLDDSGPASP